ncbi:MAG: hypothetical protein QXY01_00920 [Candidatus Bathyarchaeia archaeon]
MGRIRGCAGEERRLKIEGLSCMEVREKCRVRYPARNLCLGWRRCPCWDDEVGCRGIKEIRDSLVSRSGEN